MTLPTTDGLVLVRARCSGCGRFYRRWIEPEWAAVIRRCDVCCDQDAGEGCAQEEP